MADISELLANSDPEQFKKLLELRNDLGTEAPYQASEAANAAKAADYSQLFSKQAAQNVVDAASVPGKSAAESAEVFAPQLSKLAPTAAETMGEVASKAALPLTAAYEFLKSGPMDENEDAIVNNLRAQRGPLPNGGMSDEDAIKAYGGPIASDGSNPNASLFDRASAVTQAKLGDEDQEDEDSDEEEPSRAPASPAQELKEKLAKATGKIPVQSRMNTGDAIAQLLGKNQSDLNEAKDQRNRMQLIALLNDAAQTVGAALVPRSGLKADQAFTGQMLGMAQQPVNDVQQALAMKRQTLQDAIMQQQAKKQMAYQDPSSPESQAFRKAVLNINPNLQKVYGDDWNNITAADKELIFDPIKLKEQIEMRKDIAEQNRLIRQDKMSQAASDKQIKAAQDARKAVFSFRGNAGIQQASKDVLNSAKALDLVNQPGPKTTQDD